MPGKGSRIVVNIAGAIRDEILPPVIEHMTMRIGKTVTGIGIQFESSRIESISTTIDYSHRFSPRRFDLRVMERSLLKIERSAGANHETVD